MDNERPAFAGPVDCIGGDAGELNSRSSKVQLRVILQAFPPIGISPAATVVVPMPDGQPKNLSRIASASIRGTLALQRPRQPHQDEGHLRRRR